MSTVHSHFGQLPSSLYSIPDMVRAGEISYPNGNPLTVTSGGSTVCDPQVPAEIEAFDGQSYELNAQSPPGEATLRDFFGIDLASGQARATLPTGQGFGAVGLQNTDLSIAIGSQIDRIGNLGRFAALHNDDYLTADLLIPMEGECMDILSETFALEQLINATPVIKRYRGGNVSMWQNGGPRPSTPPISSPMLVGGFGSSNQNSCSMVLPDGTIVPVPAQMMIGDKSMHQSMNDPIHPPLPPSTSFTQMLSENDRSVFHAAPGVTQILRWDCHGTVILDEQGTMYVYSPFYLVQERSRCVQGLDRPHGPEGGPEAPMVQIQVMARLLYEQTRDGLITSYFYNAWGQLKGYVDPYGRAVGYIYGPLSSGPYGPNIITGIVDQFGRTTTLQYDSQWRLERIVLPTVTTGASGQPSLTREIKIGMSTVTVPIRLHQQYPVNPSTQQVERTLMTQLRIGRPLDLPGSESVVIDFEVLPLVQGGISRVISSYEGSTRGPSWMGSAQVGGTTTYVYGPTFHDRCPGIKWIRQTHPEGVVETYHFDEWGNETRRDLLDQSGSVASWTSLSNGPYNLITSTTDPSGLTKSFTFEFDADPTEWWWDSILNQRNVLTETLHAIGSTNTLSTVREYSFFTLVKKERLPGTPGTYWDSENTFDHEMTGSPSKAGAVVVAQRRAVNSGIGTHGIPTSLATFGAFAEVITQEDPVNRLTMYDYHPINDPDGDGNENWGSALWTGTGLPRGYLKEMKVDPANLALVTQHSYDDRGRETKMVDPKGIATQHLYNEMDQAFATAAGDWVPATNDFALGIAPNGVTKSLLIFDANGNATVQRDYNDNTDTNSVAPYIETRYHYDGLDRLVETEGMLVAPADTTVNWVQTFWVRDAMGRLIRQINADGTASSAEYTYQGQVAERREHALKYSLDSSGEPISALTALADDNADKLFTLAYATDNLLLSVTDGMGATATLEYDEYRRRVGRVDPAQAHLLRVLNSRGSVTSEEIRSSVAAGSVLLKRTEYEYDELQRLRETRAKWFDDQGAQIDDGWVTTKYGFDLADQVIEAEDDAGSVTNQEFDAAGRKIFVRYPEGLNHPGSLARDFDAFEYDANGNQMRLAMTEYRPGGSSSVYYLDCGYDDLNRKTHVIQDPTSQTPVVTMSTYDSLGNVIRSIRPGSNGNVGMQTYFDTQKRVVKTIDGYNDSFTAAVDPTICGDGLVTHTKTYDTYGHLLAERDDIDQTHVTSYEYDNLHRMNKVIYADGTYETTEYRRDGLPDRFYAKDETGGPIFDIDHVYDSAKRKTFEYHTRQSDICGGVHVKHFVYDDLGRVVDSFAESTNPLIPTLGFVTHSHYKHDSLGRILEEAQELLHHQGSSFLPIHSHTVSRDWDAFGNKKAIHSSVGTDPSGFTIEREYDRVQRLTRVEEQRTSGAEISADFRWQGAQGRLHDITHWNGVVTEFNQYDARGRLGEIRTKNSGGTTIAGRSYGYTDASTLTREVKLAGASGNDYAFVHDVFDRLVRVRKGAWSDTTQSLTGQVQLARRTFDGAQSMALLEVGVEGGTLASAATTNDTTNAVTSFGGIPIGRDGRGNTTSIGSQFFLYDTMGHQICWTDDINTLTNVVIELYDAEDRRVYRYHNGVERFHVWDGQALLQELDIATGTVDREYVEGPGIDRLIGQRVAGVPFAYHTDNKSTPYAATDQTGNVAERYDIEPFGMRTVTLGSGYSQPIGSHIGLHGGWQDPINARLYFRARVFDPILARFLSRDPLGVWGDALNLGSPYGFTGNNPTLYRDPTGLGWFSDLCSSAVNVIAGVADGAISAISLGTVQTPIAANLMGADTSSASYRTGNVVGQIGTSIAIGIASGGTGVVATLAQAHCLAGNVLDTARLGYDLLTADSLEDVGRILVDEAAQRIAGRLIGQAVDDIRGAFRGADIDIDTRRVDSSGSSGNCFLAGTLVLTSEGPKPIESVSVGDKVLSRDPDTGEQGFKPVLRTFHGSTEHVVTLRIATVPRQNGRTEHHSVGDDSGDDSDDNDSDDTTQSIRCTVGHPFWVVGRGWIHAADLRSGDILSTSGGNRVAIVDRRVDRETAAHFNFEVAGWHTYFVSGDSNRDSVWVHNNNCRGTQARQDSTVDTSKEGPRIVSHPSERAARRAAEREAGMGRHGAREQLPDQPLRPGSQSPQGPRGTRTETRSTDTGRTVHHDPYGHRDGNIPPHYGVEGPGIDGTTHHTYPTTHDPSTNR